MAALITGESLARAETSLIQAREFIPEDYILFERAFMERDGAERFLQHHMQTLSQRLPDLDPRLEPSVLTMFRHMLLVGAVAGRELTLHQ